MISTASTSHRKSILVVSVGLSLAVVSACARSDTDTTATAQPQAAPVEETIPGESLGIASVVNLRDLGGYTTSDGATVARGLIYRSNQLSEIPEMETNYGTIENYFAEALGIDAAGQQVIRDLYRQTH